MTIRRNTFSITLSALLIVLWTVVLVPADGFEIRNPAEIVFDSNGNYYIFSVAGCTIFRVTPTGTAQVLAGKNGSCAIQDGSGENARFSTMGGMAIDKGAGIIYLMTNTSTIRKVTLEGVVTSFTVSDPLEYPLTGGVVDSAGNIYAASNRGFPFALRPSIKKISPEGVLTNIAGGASSGSLDGVGSAAAFKFIITVKADAAGNLYVADFLPNYRVRKVTPEGVVSTFAGNGTGVGHTNGPRGIASFYKGPSFLAVDSKGNVYASEGDFNGRIRKIDVNGTMSDFAGGDARGYRDSSNGTEAQFQGITGMAFDASDNLYVLDGVGNMIRKITPSGAVSTVLLTEGPPLVTTASPTTTAPAVTPSSNSGGISMVQSFTLEQCLFACVMIQVVLRFLD